MNNRSQLSPTFLGIAALSFTSILGGTSYSLSKYIMEFFNPFELLTYRFFLGTLTLVLVRPSVLGLLTKEKFRLALPTGAALSISMLALWQGVKYSDTGLSAFLANSEFVIIPFISYLFFRKKISIKTALLILTGFLGIMLLSLKSGVHISFGTIFLLVSALCFAIYAVLNTELTKTLAPFELSVLNLTISTVFCAFAAVFQGFTFNFTKESLLILLYVGPIILGVRFFLITYGQSIISASNAGLIYLAEPVTAALIGCYLLDEQFTNAQLLGIAILLATVLGSFSVASQEEGKQVQAS